MNWKVVARPQVHDVTKAADWYDSQRPGLGDEFIEEILTVFDTLRTSPLIHSRQHTSRNIRWRYPKRFPYRVIYEVIESEHLVVIVAVIHAARREKVWRHRV